jgi:hypothetical protein
VIGLANLAARKIRTGILIILSAGARPDNGIFVIEKSTYKERIKERHNI